MVRPHNKRWFCLMACNFINCWKGAVDSESDISLESCSKAIAAGDGRELWQYLPNGQIASVLGKKCMTLSSGDSVSLMNCDEASADGGSSWEAQGNGMIDLCSPASLKIYLCAFSERPIEIWQGWSILFESEGCHSRSDKRCEPWSDQRVQLGRFFRTWGQQSR